MNPPPISSRRKSAVVVRPQPAVTKRPTFDILIGRADDGQPVYWVQQ